ncbi:glutamate--tRNA ligase [Ponticaulis sp.]|uniref:glutamate--tRNA ligase n=1 Tax=Ponticaulis sp. TaxID=2020902 RepID=UPI0026391677|nr:glutamate--tRNA ligase [Ponticaulis sp.]MDF1681436.1 glutamate--tRNA ligase [Ponticaulis sp.]
MSAPIVRFAPSPTGRLHVGNVRTALINWLFAKGQGGKFILRIDDTDLERSTKEYEQGLKDDLTWLGLGWDDTFNQSTRFDKYDEAVAKLKADGLLYACYETPEELERKRKIALSRGRPPVYDRAGLNLTDDEKAAFEAEGRKPHWRFKLSGDRVEWNDLVRGPQGIDTSSVSDPILVRGDGSYLYTLPSVVDDIEYDITHVVRGEDHVTNSGAQIEIFMALGGKAPEMAHTPLLVGADGQGLSKRLGSLSIQELGKKGLEPISIASLLGKIGTSDNVEIRASLDELAAEFSFDKIGRAPARFDEEELMKLNAQRVLSLSYADVSDTLDGVAALESCPDRELFWETVKENISTVSEAASWADVLYGTISSDIEAEDKGYVQTAAETLPAGPYDLETWGNWTKELKDATGRKGKGLFMPLRLALTGEGRGPDMGRVLVLLGPERAAERLKAAAA